ncbi:MAG: DUF418 domain-containing protein [Phycisphaerales bacterium]|jgi:uncharacterized protein|nr:DUF418 domain-containing protein [Phycisphaerales bacterium]
MTPLVGPTPGSSRIEALDVLRGVAVLGILLLNVRTFALASSSYAAPVYGGGETAVDMAAFIAVQVLGDLKFMAIFSFLFGVGIVLFTERAEAATGRSGGIWYRRMAWLLVIGLCHGWLLWWGDILVAYALCGMLLYPARRAPVWAQAAGGVCMLLVGSGVWWALGALIALGGPEAAAEFLPTAEGLEAEHEAWSGSWLDQTPARIELTVKLETAAFWLWELWRCGGLMLLGMAVWRARWWQRGRSRAACLAVAVIGLAIGAPLTIYGVLQADAVQWRGVDFVFGLSLWNYWGSLGVAAGWAGLALLLSQIRALELLRRVLAAVGRMALTNYLAQSLLCGVFFYGWGLGWYGHLGYASQLIVVAAIWAAQCLWSPVWLACFRFGPMEWLWRSLTYWRPQPMRRGTLPSAA